MRRLSIALAGVALTIAVSAAPAAAVTGNYVEDFEHEYVGLVVFYDEEGEFSHRCSGSLLSPTIFLTAGHCAEGVTEARVYFQQDAGANFDPELGIDPVTGYPETGGYTGTAYNFGFEDFKGFPNTRDVGIVVLDEAVPTSVVDEYGVLAAPGSLDRLATKRGRQDVTFTVSGYGLSDIRPATVSFRERLMATVQLVNLRNALTAGFNLQTSGSPGGGKGGTCFGDSGGPILYNEVIVAVTSFGLNANCAGVGFGYRTDQAGVIEWILSFAEEQGETIQVVQI